MSRHIIPGSRTRRTEGTQSKAGRAGPWYQQLVVSDNEQDSVTLLFSDDL